jgi:Tfp pilus assembly protein PilX
MRRVTPSSAQRGVAALVVTMGLFFAMLLVAAFANRNLVFEQRSSANQYRATQAFEAAEAGLEWAQAQINNVARVDGACKASGDAGALSFRDRFLRVAEGGALTAAQWSNAGVPTALQPACVRGDSGWQCSCPASGHAQFAGPAQAAPAFSVEFLAGSKSGVVRVVSRGCTSFAGACAPGSTEPSDAVARVEVSLALLPALASAPAAALTVRGTLDVGNALLGVHNADLASGGVALHSGAIVQAPLLRVGSAAGAAISGAVVSQDARLAALGSAQLFAGYFGLDRSSWAQQPVVTALTCSGDCAAALGQAVSGAGSNAMIHVMGDLDVQGPAVFGTRQQPVLIVVEGSARLRGPVTLHGVLYATSLRWDGPIASGALARGALISETSYLGDGTPDIVYDAAILATLRSRSGMFARVNGSWRDF